MNTHIMMEIFLTQQFYECGQIEFDVTNSKHQSVSGSDQRTLNLLVFSRPCKFFCRRQNCKVKEDNVHVCKIRFLCVGTAAQRYNGCKNQCCKNGHMKTGSNCCLTICCIPYSFLHVSHFEYINSFKKFICTLHVNGYLASLIVQAVRTSNTFKENFGNFIYHVLMMLVIQKVASENFQKHLTEPTFANVSVIICLNWPDHLLDSVWDCKVQQVIHRYIMLEETMAWLSTLGGGYSSLGDESESHAEIAMHISAQQFKIALEMADPVLQCKCHLFMAMGLMQRRKLRSSKIIARRQYILVKNHPLKYNHQVLQMCRGVWSRLQHFYKKFKVAKKNFT